MLELLECYQIPKTGVKPSKTKTVCFSVKRKLLPSLPDKVKNVKYTEIGG